MKRCGPGHLHTSLQSLSETLLSYDEIVLMASSSHQSTVINKTDLLGALINRDATIADQMVFNVTLSEENQVVSNQKSSGRCWLFATTNTIRLQMQRKYGLKDFQLSQSYLFFYDSLSKANW